MAAIEMVNLTKHYKQGKNVIKALDGVNLKIESGEFVAVVGRSGSGKTTLLDLLGLLLRQELRQHLGKRTPPPAGREPVQLRRAGSVGGIEQLRDGRQLERVPQRLSRL